MWIATNYKIVVRGTDDGIWRRTRLIPFRAKFKGKNDDKDMEEKLKRELPQILGWAIKGCLKWQKEGLGMPQQIAMAVEDYKTENDVVAHFCDEHIIVKSSPLYKEKASDVYKAYKDWATFGKEYCMSQSKFGTEMGNRFEKKNINGYIYYLGITLKKNDKSYVYNELEGKSI